jgi:predicted metal-dependent hydrolase
MTVCPRRPIEVVAPRRASEREIERFLAERHRWIQDKVAWARSVADRAVLGLERPGLVWLHGRPVPVDRRPGTRAQAALTEGRLVVRGPDRPAADAIQRWYRREARRRLHATATREARRMGLRFASITIRDPKTRWGSCSRLGTLAFAWRLIVAPVQVMDYVVVHELCHLRVLDHSRRFWRAMESVRPEWRDQAAWLRDHGQEVHDYRPGWWLQGQLPGRWDLMDLPLTGRPRPGPRPSSPQTGASFASGARPGT